MLYPFLLKPCFKDYLWGGSRLKTEYGKVTDTTPLAESWEFSTHPDGVSAVGNGDYRGEELREFFKRFPKALGDGYDGENPLLIKYIDAEKDLSIQVHPDDAYALKNEGGQKGKTEFWYILDADAGAEIIYGFKEKIEKEKFRDLCESGEIESVLNRVRVKKGDCFLIAPGVIHGIGAGITLAEIQQNSNLTYRVFDYNRVDKNGMKRELHLEKALDVIDFDFVPRDVFAAKGNLLCRCNYFTVGKTVIHENCNFEKKSTFTVLMCIEGKGSVEGENGFDFSNGDTIFIPAEYECEIYGNCELLYIFIKETV